MAKKPKVIVSGAAGKMGKSAVKALLDNSDKFEFVGGCIRSFDSSRTRELQKEIGDIVLKDNIEDLIKETKPDILVELSTPKSVFSNSEIALKSGLRVVIGATGLSGDQIDKLGKLSKDKKLGAIIAPNFAIGAILMMKYSKDAVKYFEKYEIIEMHHDQKLDSPSGTAVKTAQLMSSESRAVGEGKDVKDIPIHSVRLPGLVAHQEVIFGGLGQTLSIRHDTINRTSFMPGILLSCEKVMELKDLVYGLENII